MAYLVFNKETYEFRYGSGVTTYSEQLSHGRLVCRDYHAAGMPQHGDDHIDDATVTAFELELDGKDASSGWEFAGWEAHEDEERPWAELKLTNPAFKIELTIDTYCGDNGCFTRKLFLKNNSGAPVSLTRVSPLSGSLWEVKEEVKTYLGDYEKPPFRIGRYKDKHWGNEGNFVWTDVPYNATVEIGSDTGRSGHGHPFAIAHNELLGGYFAVQLEWSATWTFRFYNDCRHVGEWAGEYLRLAFSAAPTATAPMRVIADGEDLAMPPVHFSYVYGDFDDAVQALHAYQRKYILAKPIDGYDLVSYDHWSYMEHNISVRGLITEAERAAKVGAELFTVDAGWYGDPGTEWDITTGDWTLPRLETDLFPVIKRVRELGMKFALWIEPESIGVGSKLYEEHPDWIMQRWGEGLERCLDITRPEVEKFVEDTLISVIDKYGLDMLRLDYNNQFLREGGFNERDGYSENTHWRHVEAIHRIFDHIKARYPNLRLENCASGGGRTDLGMMSRFTHTQVSDWYKFPRVARIFNGMSICLPPECLMMNYGAAQHAEQYGCADTQLQMMILGQLQISGIAPDTEIDNDALVAKVQHYVKIHKEFIRPIQRTVKVYHHTEEIPGLSGTGWVVIENATPDGSKGYSFLTRLPDTAQSEWLFLPRGLDRSRSYTVTNAADGRKIKASGYELATNGIRVRLDGPLVSQLLLFEAE